MNRALLFFIATALIILASLPNLLVAVPVSSDLLQHTLLAHIANTDSPHADTFAAFFATDISFKPNVASFLLLLSLQKVFNPLLSAKLYLLLFSAAMWLSALFFANSCKLRSPHTTALAALLATFFWPVYMGFLPFIMCYPLYLLILANWIRLPPGPKRCTCTCLGMLVMYSFHVIGVAIALFAIAFLWLQRGYLSGHRRFLTPAYDLIAMLLAAGLCLSFLFGSEETSSQIRFSPPLAAVKAALGYSFTSLGAYTKEFNTVFALLFALGVALLCWRCKEIRTFGILALLLALISVCMPIQLGILWPAGPRVLPFAFLSALGALQLPSIRVRRVVQGALLLTLCVNSLSNTRTAISVNKEYEDFLEASDTLPQGSRFYPLIQNRPIDTSSIDAFWSAPNLYTLETAAIHPCIFAKPYWKTGSASVQYRNYEKFPFHEIYESDEPKFEPEIVRKLLTHYEYVLIWADHEHIQRLRAELPETTIAFTDERLLLLHSR